MIGSCKFNYHWSLSDVKLRFRKVKLSVCMPWRHVWGSGGTALLILNLATRWHWVVTFTLCQIYVWIKSPWDTFNMRLVAAQSQFWCQLNKDRHWTVWPYCVIFARHLAHFSLLTCQVQSIGNHWGEGGDSVVKVSYWQLTWSSGWTARNFAALVFDQKGKPAYMSS